MLSLAQALLPRREERPCFFHGLQAVLAAQQVHLQRLQDELHEFIRKLDYRLARQPYGREADAWRRAVALYIGMRGG